MSRRIPVLSYVLIGLVLAASSSMAARKSGSTTAAFLKISTGARQAALGSATTVLSDDINQAFVNPAGITLNSGQLQATYTRNNWIADISYDAGAVGIGLDLPLLGESTIGLSLASLGKDDIPADRDFAPALLPYEELSSSTYNYGESVIGLTIAKPFSDKLDMGITVKMISSDIDDKSASAIAVDAGAIYDVGYNGFTIGARINNLGSDMKYVFIEEPLPLSFTIGAGIDVVNTGSTQIRMMVDAAKPQDQDQLINWGTEYTYAEMVQFRGGYKLNYSGIRDDNDLEISDEGISFGAGLDLPLADVGLSGIGLRVDYNYSDFNNFDAVHRFTFNFQWQ